MPELCNDTTTDAGGREWKCTRNRHDTDTPPDVPTPLFNPTVLEVDRHRYAPRWPNR